MNKFLYAMGIVQWQSRRRDASATELYLLADADGALLQHPIVSTVLELLGIAAKQCRVVSEVAPGQTVLWAFAPHEASGALLSTPAIATLQMSSQNKRALWQQLWPHLEAR
ncbi:DNA polymerase III subunit psi [Shewanella sp. YIC-542]|uniref:DNA polymerase III subunit psi n=1 Tax=Shewanella mytili TaxID=3377111 RepID=UPI00398E3C29